LEQSFRETIVRRYLAEFPVSEEVSSTAPRHSAAQRSHR